MIRKNGKTYKLDAKNTTLLIDTNGAPQYLYYGKSIKTNGDYSVLTPERDWAGNAMFLTPVSSYGNADFREPSLMVEYADGSFATRFTFLRAKIIETSVPENLPAAHGNGETLSLEYEDSFSKLKLCIDYTVYDDSDGIVVSQRLTNNGKEPVKIKKISSLQLELWGNDYTLVTFDGSWGSERQKHEVPFVSGLHVNQSTAGSSSPFHNPLVLAKNKSGVYAINLIYSGNHKESMESDAFNRTRLLAGINDFMFEWTLAPTLTFCTPQAVMTYGQNEDEVSCRMCSFVTDHILNGKWKDKERPVLVNNWEGTEFAFTKEKIEKIIDKAAESGAELFVLDDGWFGHRDSDASSLGDWFDYTQKTGGVDKLADYAREKGMKFGIWVEPEMISEDSELYAKHPEYVMKQPRRTPFTIRNQLMLNLADENVCAYIVRAVSRVITLTKAAYVKWDYNRFFTDPYSRGISGGEYFHRYMLGLYSVLARLTEKFPNVLFESCASGGGRFDLGMFCYMPQTWVSDDTDARERLYIQSGTSYGYPQSTFGSHVSQSPNLQSGNRSPLETRFNMSVCGCLGYEMDMTKCSEEEMKVIQNQIAFYKKHRTTFQYGTLHRIGDAFKDNVTGFLFVDSDKEEAIAVVAVKEKRVGEKNPRFTLTGLDENALYRVTTREQNNYKQTLSYEVGGDVLMNGSLVLEDIFADAELSFNSNPIYTRMYVIKKSKKVK